MLRTALASASAPCTAGAPPACCSPVIITAASSRIRTARCCITWSAVSGRWLRPVPDTQAGWSWRRSDRRKPPKGPWSWCSHPRSRRAQGTSFPPPAPAPPNAKPARMLSPWLTAASTRLRGRSQKTAVGSKGAWAGVVVWVVLELVGWVAAVLAALGAPPLVTTPAGPSPLDTRGWADRAEPPSAEPLAAGSWLLPLVPRAWLWAPAPMVAPGRGRCSGSPPGGPWAVVGAGLASWRPWRRT